MAIVGIGCLLPGGVAGPKQFWEFLCAGRSGIVEIPADRWNVEGFYDPTPGMPGKSITKWGGFVPQITEFDADFFGISPREAESMDPQQRVMLHTVWEALEDAGIAPDSLAGSNTGVFIGVALTDYATLARYRQQREDVHAGTGVALSIVSNRVSHRLDLRGPSLSVDTACSSSLVATDLACHALWNGECDLAIAGGVNAIFDPAVFVNFSTANMMSPRGLCHTFDAGADGYVRGEGCGVVILKKLSKALADRDRVYAVINSTAVNQDGRTTTITVPSAEAQAAMLREAVRRAGMKTDDITYVEAHGTGTPVGDPIEALAIGGVFGEHRQDGAAITVGAVKTAYGHQETAAGIVGLIKTALCIHHGAIPANLNFTKPNPNIPFDALHIEVPVQLTPWQPAGKPRAAAVNSFGFGGTNACAVLSEAPRAAPIEDAPDDGNPWVVPISAASESALQESARRLSRALGEAGPKPLGLRDVASTLGQRRAHLMHRAGFVARSTADLQLKLDQFTGAAKPVQRDKRAPADVVVGRRNPDTRIVFAFGGQGGQWWAMGRTLLDSDPVFRAAAVEFDGKFRKLVDWSPLEELYRDAEMSRLSQTRFTQATIFCIQLGLIARWKAWGVVPDAVIGHSFGEVGAAYAAGALSMDDVTHLIRYRSHYTSTRAGMGGIAAVGMGADEMRRKLAEWNETKVEIAGINASSMINIAGHTDAMERTLARLVAEQPDLFIREIHIDYPPHCFVMETIKDDLLREGAKLSARTADVPIYSTVTGGLLKDQLMDGSYWWRNARQAVEFKSAIDAVIKDGYRLFVEIGPHANLAGLISGALAEQGKTGVSIPSLLREQDDASCLNAAIATLYANGVKLDWSSIGAREYNFVELPGTPVEKKRILLESEGAREALQESDVHPLLGRRVKSAVPRWRAEIDLKIQPYIVDHQVQGQPLFPAAGYLELLVAAAREIFGSPEVELEDATFVDAMFMSDGAVEIVETVYTPERQRVAIYSRTKEGDGEWTLRAQARVRPASTLRPEPVRWPTQSALKAMPSIARRAFYQNTKAHGFHFGPSFQGVQRAWVKHHVIYGAVGTTSAIVPKLKQFHLHPARLDACLHLVSAIATGDNAAKVDNKSVYLPVGLKRLRIFGPVPRNLRVRATTTRLDARDLVVNYDICDQDGTVVVELAEFTSRAVPNRAKAPPAGAQLGYYADRWTPAPVDGKPARFAARGRWLVFADSSAACRQIVEAMAKQKQRCVIVGAGAAYRQSGKDRFVIRPDEKADYDRLLDSVAADGLAGILHLWCLAPGKTDAAGLMAAQKKGTLSAMLLAQVLAARESVNARVWIATPGIHGIAEAGDGAPRDWALAHLPLAGLARTIGTEVQRTRCTTIDVLPMDVDRIVPTLISELAADGPEFEIALRGDQRFVRRMDRAEPADMPVRRVPSVQGDTPTAYRVTMSAPGLFDNLMLVESDRPQPKAGEIRVGVRAVGVNFRDIMAATGLLPEEAEVDAAWNALGLECDGIVAELGPGVRNLKVGDRVMVTARGCLASDIVAPAHLAHKIPRHIGFAEAATIPSVFMTAYYALVTLGHLKRGERVLIHLATGGVGLAAVQIAQMIGAEIFATAGSPSKRAYLKKLGIKHVMSSRTLDFADEIMRITKGEGVDVVLNSLAGPAIDRGLSVLRSFGRFLEIGKRDVYEDSAIGMRALRQNIAFHVIDLANLGERGAGTAARVFGELLGLFAARKLTPLPTDTFPVERVADAFRHMSKAQHMGKVVVTLGDAPVDIALSTEREIRFRKDGAYLVTGGLSGFGLETGKWLAAHGAGHLYLMSRSGAATAEAAAGVIAMRKAGAKVTVVKGDVTDPAHVKSALAQIARSKVPLAGVIHAAMVLDDAFIPQLDEARLNKVLAPKIVGAWNLHKATEKLDLDFFCCYSSVAALLGSVGQGNYVAANAYLDGLMRYRRQRGLPGLAVNWGALGETGVVHRNKALQRYMETMGVPAIAMREAFAALATLLRKDEPAAAFFKVDWQALGRANPRIAQDPRLAGLAAVAAGGQAGGRIRAAIMAAAASNRPSLLMRYLIDQVARVLRTDAAKIEPDRPLAELGLDSLTSFELKNRVEGELAINLPVGKFLQKPTITGLTAAILEKLEEATANEGAMDAAGTVEPGAVETLSIQQTRYWERYHAPGADPRTPGFRNADIALAFTVKPSIDVPKLGAAFAGLLERHRILRTVFPAEAGRPVARVLDRHPYGVEEHATAELVDAAFRARLEELAWEPFDLQTGPLIRVHVLHRAAGVDVLLLRMQHMVTDGWSIQLVVRDLLGRYFDLPMPKSDHPFADYDAFIKWEREFIASPEGEQQFQYWREQFRDPGPPMKLPYDRARPDGVPQKGGVVVFEFDEDDTAAIQHFAKARGVSSFAVLFAAYKALLFGYSGSADIPVWSAVANRGNRQFLETIGWVNNRVMVRDQVSRDMTFRACVDSVSSTLTEAVMRQEYPFVKLLQEVAKSEPLVRRSLERPVVVTSIWQSEFSERRPETTNAQSIDEIIYKPGSKLTLGAFELSAIPLPNDGSHMDMVIYVLESGGRIFVEWKYIADLFDRSTIQRIFAQYADLVRRAVARPTIALGELVSGLAEAPRSTSGSSIPGVSETASAVPISAAGAK
ncbi:MAG: SDR family NAD(P)-dependent oxidoreductase [Alphaproteobacteria bacterium]